MHNMTKNIINLFFSIEKKRSFYVVGNIGKRGAFGSISARTKQHRFDVNQRMTTQVDIKSFNFSMFSLCSRKYRQARSIWQDFRPYQKALLLR